MKRTIATLNLFLLLILITGLFHTGLSAREPLEIAKLQNGLLPKVLIKGEKPWTLAERMKFHNVPAVSIAVIKDFKVVWSKGFGVKDLEKNEPVNNKTLFQAASISKPVAALAALHWVQKGKLSLDTNINDTLKSWKLKDITHKETQKVTLKHLLSHSGGTTVHGFRGYAAGEKVPSVTEVLKGKKPANSDAVKIDKAPGKFRYSGGGFTIMQLMLTETLKKKFPMIMDETVLKPLGMSQSTYMQPLPAKYTQNAAKGYRPKAEAIKGNWHTYPEMAAAGLWTTAEDLGRFAVEIQLSMQGKSNTVLSKKTTEAMLTPFNSNFMGLGVMLENEDEAAYFQHGGANEGYRCFMVAHRTKGYGAVIMTNSDTGGKLYKEILRGIAHIYNWDHYQAETGKTITLAPEKLKPLQGKYEVDSDHSLTITYENGHLYGQVSSAEKMEIMPISENEFIRKNQTGVFRVEKDKKTGKVLRIIAERNNVSRTYERKEDNFTVPLDLLLAGDFKEATQAYRAIRKANPDDRNVKGMRLLMLTQQMIANARIEQALTLLHLTAEFHPDLVKQMYNTLNNEMQMVLKHPKLPDSAKQMIKKSYNSMLKKLGLAEFK